MRTRERYQILATLVKYINLVLLRYMGLYILQWVLGQIKLQLCNCEAVHVRFVSRQINSTNDTESNFI